MKHKQNYKVFQLNNAKNVNQQEIPKKNKQNQNNKNIVQKRNYK